jgi:hypothetical protein
MLQDLAALAPPAIVCVGFIVGAWAIVRRELAPKRRAREEAEAAEDAADAAALAAESAREHADHEQGGS